MLFLADFLLLEHLRKTVLTIRCVCLISVERSNTKIDTNQSIRIFVDKRFMEKKKRIKITKHIRRKIIIRTRFVTIDKYVFNSI